MINGSDHSSQTGYELNGDATRRGIEKSVKNSERS